MTRILPTPTLLATLLAAALLTACGGGGSDAPAAAAGNNAGGNANGGGGAAAATSCNLALFQAGTVATPTATELAAYAGTYTGDEGAYGPNPGDAFVKSGNATFVLGSDGAVTYQGVAYTAGSICLDKAAGATGGRILYVEAGKGHVDVSDKPLADLGSAWGVSPADGTTIFTKGAKP
jgi:hypothetical protein